MSQKKKRNRSTKSNVAQNIQNTEKKQNLSIKRKAVNKMKKTKSIRFETMKKKRKKVIKCIDMHDSVSKFCVKVIRRRNYCSRYLFQRTLRIEHVNSVANRKVFFNFFFRLS